MATSQQLLNLSPYETDDFPPSGPDMVPDDPPDVKQLKIDIINVIEGRVSIDSFPTDYQEKMKSYYRFYGQRSNPKYPFYPKLIRSTLDAV
jgi:hypothetical protein